VPVVIISIRSSLFAATMDRSNLREILVTKIVARTFQLLLPALLNDQLVQSKLLCSMLKHTLFDAVLSDELDDIYLLPLSNSMCMVHSLQVTGTRVVLILDIKGYWHVTYQSLS
jgi:hypothetical protein